MITGITLKVKHWNIIPLKQNWWQGSKFKIIHRVMPQLSVSIYSSLFYRILWSGSLNQTFIVNTYSEMRRPLFWNPEQSASSFLCEAELRCQHSRRSVPLLSTVSSLSSHSFVFIALLMAASRRYWLLSFLFARFWTPEWLLALENIMCYFCAT